MLYFGWAIALCGIILLVLSLIVVKNRQRTSQPLGNEKNDMLLQRAIRAHGNFCEIAPLTLASIWLLTLTPIDTSAILVAGIVFICARILHALSLLYIEPQFKTIQCRVIGMMLGFLVIIFCVSVFIYYQI